MWSIDIFLYHDIITSLWCTPQAYSCTMAVSLPPVASKTSDAKPWFRRECFNMLSLEIHNFKIPCFREAFHIILQYKSLWTIQEVMPCPLAGWQVGSRYTDGRGHLGLATWGLASGCEWECSPAWSASTASHTQYIYIIIYMYNNYI